jgi:uncharacterized membrane protein YphA (DoxX/SURF4 family)
LRLHILFSTFPRGVPGLGLLLLRMATSSVLVLQGASILSTGVDSAVQNSLLPLVEVLSGVCLLLGFLTPIAATIAMLVEVAMAVSWLRMVNVNGVQTRQGVLVVAVMSAALILLGPGAFSIDSRLFGRREVIIPRRPRTPDR